MNWIKIGRILGAPINEIKMRTTLNRKYSLRSVTEVVRKFEEMKFKNLEALRTKNDQADYYKACHEALGWVIRANTKDQ